MGCAPSYEERGRWDRRDTEYTDYGSDEELNPKTREHTRASLGVHIVNKARYQGDDGYLNQRPQHGRFYQAVKRVQNRPKSPRKIKNDTNELGMKRLPTRLEIMIEQMRGRRPKKRNVKNLQTQTYLRVKEMDKQAKEEAEMRQFSRQSRIIQSRGGSSQLSPSHYQNSPLPDIVEEEYWSYNGSVRGNGSPSPRGIRGSPSPRGVRGIPPQHDVISGSSPHGSPRYQNRPIHRSVTVYEPDGKVSRGTDYNDSQPSPIPSPRMLSSRSVAIQTEFTDEDHLPIDNIQSHYSTNQYEATPKSPDYTQKQEPWAKKRGPAALKPERELDKDRLKMEIFQTAAAGHLERQRELKRFNDQIKGESNSNDTVTDSSSGTAQVSKLNNGGTHRHTTPMVPYSRKSPRAGSVTPRGSDVGKVTHEAPLRGSRTYQELSHGAKKNMDDSFMHNVSVNAIPKASLRTGTASTA